MSKGYGLIIPKQRPSIFNESDSDSEMVPTGLKKTLKKQDKILQNKAVEEDPTVYQYDEIYDEMDKKRKESKLSRKDLDRKPKYINKLLAAADRRKKENERRIERQVQKERETEGDEFKDKEAFVTSSYKKKLEEMKEMEEQEKREDYLEAIGDVTKQGNLDGFYRHLYDQKVNYEEKTEKTRKYRKRQESDSDKSEKEESVEVKKEHLPSNLDADSDFSIDSSDSEEEKEKEEEKKEKQEVKEEEKKEEEPEVPEPPPPKKPKIDIWKKRTVGEVFDAAVQSSDLPATCAVPGEKPLPLPAIFCPNPIRPNTELIYSSYEDSFPEKECLRCSLTLNNENSAVFVKCFRCQRVFKPPSLVETQKCVEMAERTKKK